MFVSYLCHRCSHFSCSLRNERISHRIEIIFQGSFLIKVNGPEGWSWDPEQVECLHSYNDDNFVSMCTFHWFTCTPPPPPHNFSGWCIWTKEDLSVGACCNWSYWLQWQWRHKFSVHGVRPYSYSIESSLKSFCSANK